MTRRIVFAVVFAALLAVTYELGWETAGAAFVAKTQEFSA
jgi:hypothetical protein